MGGNYGGWGLVCVLQVNGYRCYWYLPRCCFSQGITPHAAVHNLYIRTPEVGHVNVRHVEAFYENKIIVNCCIKLVHLLTYIYDARSHLHQIRYN